VQNTGDVHFLCNNKTLPGRTLTSTLLYSQALLWMGINGSMFQCSLLSCIIISVSTVFSNRTEKSY
jgi:hypothetical protein